MYTRKIVILVLLVQVLNAASQRVYDCMSKDISQYKMDQITGFQYAIISIPQSEEVTQITVEIGIQGGIKYGTGSLQLQKNTQDTLQDICSINRISWKLKFPVSDQIPIIKSIHINSFKYCEGPNAYFPTTRTYKNEFLMNSSVGKKMNLNPNNDIELINKVNERLGRRRKIRPRSSLTSIPCHNWIFPGMKQKPTEVPWVQNLVRECGKSEIIEKDYRISGGSKTVVGGMDIQPNEFPWLVLLTSHKMKHRCGATLISNSFVVTAAHCVKGLQEVILQFGKHNITNVNEEGSIIRKSQKIIIHPNFNGNAEADIALVSFEPINFSDKIHPACIWSFGQEENVRDGRVVGWGQIRVNDGPDTDIPMTAKLTIKELQECRKSKFGMRFASNDTFCAGGGNTDANSCHGDSGGGFYIVRGRTWYLHGIISHSAGTKYTCENVSAFVNVVHYLEWIKPYLLSFIFY